tara:strand:+ start:2125 stop:2313 length:189 start_codon:yes stop_codon:yes gene_type:complete
LICHVAKIKKGFKQMELFVKNYELDWFIFSLSLHNHITIINGERNHQFIISKSVLCLPQFVK